MESQYPADKIILSSRLHHPVAKRVPENPAKKFRVHSAKKSNGLFYVGLRFLRLYVQFDDSPLSIRPFMQQFGPMRIRAPARMYDCCGETNAGHFQRGRPLPEDLRRRRTRMKSPASGSGRSPDPLHPAARRCLNTAIRCRYFPGCR